MRCLWKKKIKAIYIDTLMTVKMNIRHLIQCNIPFNILQEFFISISRLKIIVLYYPLYHLFRWSYNLTFRKIHMLFSRLIHGINVLWRFRVFIRLFEAARHTEYRWGLQRADERKEKCSRGRRGGIPRNSAMSGRFLGDPQSRPIRGNILR